MPGRMSLLGAGRRSGSSTPPPTPYEQYIARISDPGATRRGYIATLIDSLVTSGVWDRLDAAWLMASDTAANGRVNLKSASFPLTQVGTVSFTADQGFTGDGSTGFFRTGLAPSANTGGNYTRDSASLGAYIRNSRTTNQLWCPIGSDGSSGINAAAYFLPRNSSGFQWRFHTPSSQTTTASNAQGMWIQTRTSSIALATYRNGSSIGTNTISSTAVLDREILVLAVGLNDNSPFWRSQDQVAFAFVSGGLNATQAAALSSAVNAYLTSLGTNVY